MNIPRHGRDGLMTTLPREQRHMNVLTFDKDQRAVLRELRVTGPQSRVALADRLEFSPTALTRLSRELLSLDVVQELPDPGAQRRGRPAIPLALSPRGGYAVGATAHKGMLDIALVDFVGNSIATHSEATAALDPVAFARKVRRITHVLVERHDLLGRRMLGMGVAIPGPAYNQAGDRWSVVDVMPGWRGAPLREIFSAELGWPLWLENDANAAAIAELYRDRQDTDCSNMAVVLLGYGIGAGVIVEGQLLRGQHGVAGEIGCLFPTDKPRPSPLDLLSNLRDAGCAVTSFTDIDIDAGDQADVIETWMDRAARQLEIVCNTAFAWFDPGVIVIAGTLPAPILAGLGDRLIASNLATTIEQRRPPIRISRLKESPVTLGAALLPIHALTG